jgi:hypothetical protein
MIWVVMGGKVWGTSYFSLYSGDSQQGFHKIDFWGVAGRLYQPATPQKSS